MRYGQGQGSTLLGASWGCGPQAYWGHQTPLRPETIRPARGEESASITFFVLSLCLCHIKKDRVG